MPAFASQRIFKRFAATSLVFLSLMAESCGGGSSGGVPVSGTYILDGNWQFNLLQEEPRTSTPNISVSGFLQQSNSSLTGSLQFPPSLSNGKCGGVGSVAGSVNDQSLTFSLNIGGTILDFTGVLAQNNSTMSGSYTGEGGACYGTATSGTWSAQQIPPLNGSFTGELLNSTYMEALLGQPVVPPIAVTGTIAQAGGIAAASATVTGTINAVAYPCFRSANFAGTISGQNLLLTVFNYKGNDIGTIGTLGSPLTVSIASSGVSLVGLAPGQGLTLNNGSCPAVMGFSSDSAQVQFTFSQQ